MDNARRQQLLRRYEDASRAVVVAIDHVSGEHLDLRPAKGGWSPREIVHHLANAQMVESLRLRRMLAENTPMLEPESTEGLGKMLDEGSRPPGWDWGGRRSGLPDRLVSKSGRHSVFLAHPGHAAAQTPGFWG